MIECGNKQHLCIVLQGRAVNAQITCQSILVDITSTTSVDKKREASSGRAHTKSIFHKLDMFTAAENECQQWMMTQEYNERILYIKDRTFNKAEMFEEKEYKKKELIDLSAESQRVPYAAELRMGYDATPYNQGQIQHTKLGVRHIQAMRDKLDARSIEYEPNDGIQKLTKKLTTKLHNNWVQQNPGVDPKIYDDDNSKTKFFKPVTDINKFKYEVVG